MAPQYQRTSEQASGQEGKTKVFVRQPFAIYLSILNIKGYVLWVYEYYYALLMELLYAEFERNWKL